MPLTPEQRKRLLHGTRYIDIGVACNCSLSKVSEVINDRARDVAVEQAISKIIGLPVEEVFTRWDAEARREKHIALFWSHVDKTDGCWNWNGARHVRGYGKLRFLDQHVSAHRLSYELANGPIAIGGYVCHTCDNPRCVNPAHLYLGTALTNNRDTMSRGRRPRSYRKGDPAERFTERMAS